MTRINCIPVEELTDKHLLAEYRELPRVSALTWKWSQNSANTSWIDTDLADEKVYRTWNLPRQYRLGTGHVKFFYNKGEYLRKRFEEQIVPEMQRRGFKTNFTKYRSHPDGMNQDWTPDDAAIQVNRARIKERLDDNAGRDNRS